MHLIKSQSCAQMDLFDFDGTLFAGETGTEFMRWLLSRDPAYRRFFIFPLLGYLLYGLFPWHLEWGKRVFFYPLSKLNYRPLIPLFWQEMDAKGRLADWFAPAENDRPCLVITASPRELVEPALVGRRACPLIATELNLETGRMEGHNNRHREKLRRFLAAYPAATVRRMYTDSPSADAPLCEVAQEVWLVRNLLPKKTEK